MHFIIKNCTISDSTLGILIENVTLGTGLIIWNVFSNNNVSIQVIDTANCSIVYNVLENNSDYSIKLSSTAINCSVFRNDFIDNNLGGGSQALDDGITNYWYYPEASKGNYWSDIGLNLNYSINGTAGSVDFYPEPNPLFESLFSFKFGLNYSYPNFYRT